MALNLLIITYLEVTLINSTSYYYSYYHC